MLLRPLRSGGWWMLGWGLCNGTEITWASAAMQMPCALSQLASNWCVSSECAPYRAHTWMRGCTSHLRPLVVLVHQAGLGPKVAHPQPGLGGGVPTRGRRGIQAQQRTGERQLACGVLLCSRRHAWQGLSTGDLTNRRFGLTKRTPGAGTESGGREGRQRGRQRWLAVMHSAHRSLPRCAGSRGRRRPAA